MNPVIRPLPTEYDIRHWVDTLITPERADIEAPLVAKLVLTVANADDDELYPLAVAAAKTAFLKTTAFQQAFEKFADLPGCVRPIGSRPAPVIQYEDEQ